MKTKIYRFLKSKITSIICLITAVTLFAFSLYACDDATGGSGNTTTDTNATLPSGVTYTDLTDQIKSPIQSTLAQMSEEQLSVDAGENFTLINATTDNYDITTGGNYVIEGTVTEQISVSNTTETPVHLFLSTATLSTTKPCINSSCDLIITLIGENSATNTKQDKNAITCDGNLTINGSGTLSVTSAKTCLKSDGKVIVKDATLILSAGTEVGYEGHGIKGDCVLLLDAKVTVSAAGSDGIHAESAIFDAATTEPDFNFESGYVYIAGSGSIVTINVTDDGIQADSAVYIVSGSISITTNGGAPTSVTEYSSDNASGKGIKVGTITYGESDIEVSENPSEYLYTILIEDGTFNLNTNDDALHSNNNLIILGGSFTVKSGDDGIHADEYISIAGGTITVEQSYEGVESARMEISGQNTSVTVYSVDDGINAADGTQTSMFGSNPNCYVLISGGVVSVYAQGDGIDSNGTVSISGGKVYVVGPASGGNGALDSNGDTVITGGSLLSVSYIDMVVTPTSQSTQNVLALGISRANVNRGTVVSVKDSNGTVLDSVTSNIALSTCVVIYSSAELTTGSTYYVNIDGQSAASIKLTGTLTTSGVSSQTIGGHGGGFWR